MLDSMLQVRFYTKNVTFSAHAVTRLRNFGFLTDSFYIETTKRGERLALDKSLEGLLKPLLMTIHRTC